MTLNKFLKNNFQIGFFWLLALICFFLVLLSSTPAKGAQLYDRIAIEIQNQAITENEVRSKVLFEKQQRAFANLTEIPDKELTIKVVNDLINDNLLELEAEKLGVKVSQEQLNSELENYKANNKLTGATFEELLKNQNTTPSDFKRLLIKKIKISQLVGYRVRGEINITDEMLEDRYESKYKNKLKYRFAHILRKIPANADEKTIRAAVDEIAFIRESLKPDQSNFAELAKKYSDDPSSSNGGEVSPIYADDLIVELANPLKEMKPGEIRSPVLSPLGAHLLRLISIEEGESQTFESVKNKIADEIYGEQFEIKFKNLINELRSRYQINFKNTELAKLYNESIDTRQ